MKKLVFPALLILAITAMSFTLTMTDEEKKGLGRAQVIDGIEVYIMSQPLREYEVTGEVSVYDAGITASYVDDWVNRYVEKAKKLKKDGITVDAIVYTSGKSASVVKWK